jgi:hypothetical protein
MVEVFKTNVTYKAQANRLIEQLHKDFPEYKANFDLEDCDKILRVACTGGFINTYLLMNFLKQMGCQAEVLPDEAMPSMQAIFMKELTPDK